VSLPLLTLHTAERERSVGDWKIINREFSSGTRGKGVGPRQQSVDVRSVIENLVFVFFLIPISLSLVRLFFSIMGAPIRPGEAKGKVLDLPCRISLPVFFFTFSPAAFCSRSIHIYVLLLLTDLRIHLTHKYICFLFVLTFVI
jgi:hypothetical protein